jgi:hypothetical protein
MMIIEDNGLAYKDINNCYYYSATLILFFLNLFCAILIPDVKILFEIVGTIAANFLSFICPATFYLKARSLCLQRGENSNGITLSEDHRYLAKCSYF